MITPSEDCKNGPIEAKATKLASRRDDLVDRGGSSARTAMMKTLFAAVSALACFAGSTNQWHDKVYLSLTPQVTEDSILIQDLGNQAALSTGEQYTATTVPVPALPALGD